MERRGRIPVAKFRTQEAKSRSRSRVREPDYNEQDPETDLFTLLEDNIALKEENKALKQEIETSKKLQSDFQEDKKSLEHEIKELKEQHSATELQMKDLTAKYSKLSGERNALDKLHKMKVDIIENLSKDMELLQEKKSVGSLTNASLTINSANFKGKLLKIMPTLNGTYNDLESLVDLDSTVNVNITLELVERILDEFLTLKSTLSAVELQLYEANEKVSELLEHQHQLDEENETLRSENVNLTKVAKLLTENMKESVETSKKMEAALVKLKKRNDDLVAKTRDLTDGQLMLDDAKTIRTINQEGTTASPTTEKCDAELEEIQQEVEAQNRDHGERIVEMKNLIDAAIEKTTNAELKTLQVKLEVLEEELRQALIRAENAERELQKCKNSGQTQLEPLAPIPPPPQPPPPPPPPPAPLPLNFILGQSSLNDSIARQNLRSVGGADGGVESDCNNKIIDTVKQQVKEAATGVDALVRELKSGRVTLRRRGRRKTNTNEALQEMFQVLEISQKQNRDSKICIDMNF